MMSRVMQQRVAPGSPHHSHLRLGRDRVLRALRPLGVLAGVILCCAGLTAGCRHADPTTGTGTAAAVPGSAAASMDSYYLGTCAACGSVLGSRGEAVDAVHEHRRLRLCSAACLARFRADPESVIAHADRVMIADQSPHYPLATSIVSGRPLGDSPTEFIWGNRLFRVADASERDRVLADPARFIRLLDKEVLRAQAPAYGMPSKCPVQGDILPGDPIIDIVVANRMVRVCCGRCVRVVRERPYQYLAMVDYANRQAAASRAGDAEPTR